MALKPVEFSFNVTAFQAFCKTTGVAEVTSTCQPSIAFADVFLIVTEPTKPCCHSDDTAIVQSAKAAPPDELELLLEDELLLDDELLDDELEDDELDDELLDEELLDDEELEDELLEEELLDEELEEELLRSDVRNKGSDFVSPLKITGLSRDAPRTVRTSLIRQEVR